MDTTTIRETYFFERHGYIFREFYVDLGTCENLAACGMDGRESTRVRTPSRTPKRFRSASSPFSSPADQNKMETSGLSIFYFGFELGIEKLIKII